MISLSPPFPAFDFKRIFKNKRICLIVLISLLLLPPFHATAQSSKEMAAEHLKNLEKGALLVRLPTEQYKLQALIDAGKQAEAKKAARRLKVNNRAVYTAFKGGYNYSKVYFFYSLSSDDIKNRNFRGNLLNEQLEPDPNIVPAEEHFYIAEFTVIEPIGLSALAIMDLTLNYIEKPFPYYVKEYDIIPIFKRNRLSTVRMLNNNLHYYRKKAD
jgi:hypothetical protein